MPTGPPSVIAPTFDERDKDLPHGHRLRAARLRVVDHRSATWIEYGSVYDVVGVTSPSQSAAATVTSLKVEPGS